MTARGPSPIDGQVEARLILDGLRLGYSSEEALAYAEHMKGTLTEASIRLDIAGNDLMRAMRGAGARFRDIVTRAIR